MSRWDTYVPPAQQQQQTVVPNFPQGVFLDQSASKSGLIATEINTIDPGFYDCVYSVANSAQVVIERCYKDIGCCANGCCKNSSWHTKYSWAVALIVIFCVLVIFAVFIYMVVWLISRSKDKRQKKQLIGGSGMSPANSQMSLAQPIQGGYHFGTGPYATPPNNGYRY